MKVLTGFAVMTDAVGKRVAYTYSTVNEQGMVVESNIKESYVVLDEVEIGIIKQLEDKIKTRLA
ncbi:Uncharacterised protein [uncultured Clostridium sp.]|uniref:hypothetical protein n=1 Tax=uncultured Clostridium sp. TaxID=59620 RepID=UPI000822D690|nr:hypothetical protein [uncultured Clostridium sp.]SCJ99160.1 Uncharacterised protein [uncultured Clostridium sp.]